MNKITEEINRAHSMHLQTMEKFFNGLTLNFDF